MAVTIKQKDTDRNDEPQTLKIKLVGCERYNYKGETYERGKAYLVNRQKAMLLLGKEDDWGQRYFAQIFEEEVIQSKPETVETDEGTLEVAEPVKTEEVNEEVIENDTPAEVIGEVEEQAEEDSEEVEI